MMAEIAELVEPGLLITTRWATRFAAQAGLVALLETGRAGTVSGPTSPLRGRQGRLNLLPVRRGRASGLGGGRPVTDAAVDRLRGRMALVDQPTVRRP
jgi:hypothetical protein